jgi:hypothetical protein
VDNAKSGKNGPVIRRNGIEDVNIIGIVINIIF